MIVRARAAGFTLIELLISVVIVGLLASITVPLAELAIQRNKESELRQALRDIRRGLDAYKRAVDEGRVASNPLASGYPPTLDILVQGVSDIRNPDKNARLYFLRRIPRDPFADPQIDPARSWGKRSYSSSGDDPSEGDDVFDVYSRSEGTGLNGVRYRLW